MRVYPQGVTVITTKVKERLWGLTLSSFTSVSLEPPLVLASIAKGSESHDVFATSKEFAINFLGDDQKSVSDRFAGRTQVTERFHGLRLQFHATGSPIIDGLRAFIECRTWRVYEGGDHSLLLGEVVNAKKVSNKPPLVYYTQQYTTVLAPENAPSPPEILW